MFLGPLKAMKPWNTKGIEGISRFLRKLWRLVILDNDYKINPKIDINKIHEVNPDTEKLLHQSMKKITNDYENLSFNTIISQLMILLNNLSKLEIIPLEMIKIFLQLLAPLAPHISEELWMHLGNKTSIVKAKWPVANKEKLKENFTKIIIQVNGKYKGNGLLPNNHTKNDVIKLGRSIEKVRSQIEGKEIIKEIYIPNKILNFVVNMKVKVRIFRKFNRYLLVFLTSFILCNGNESNFGKGFVTSILNEPNFSLNNKNSEIQLHDEIKFWKKINFLTEYQDEIFLKLSNNVVIGILENSDLTISNFTQKVSQTKYDTLLREQGNSYFKGLLNEGKLVIITQKFAPSTEFLIETPHSKIGFNVAKCIIKYRYKILGIWLFGNNGFS